MSVDVGEAGSYFPLIKVHPIQPDTGGTVGVAAATGLALEVEQSSFFDLGRLRIAYFFLDNSPVSKVLPPSHAGIILPHPLSWPFRIRFERRR